MRTGPSEAGVLDQRKHVSARAGDVQDGYNIGVAQAIHDQISVGNEGSDLWPQILSDSPGGRITEQ